MASSACNHQAAMRRVVVGLPVSHRVGLLGRATRRRREAAGFVVARVCRKRVALEGLRLQAERPRYTGALRCERASLETRALSGLLRTAF